MKTPKVSVLMPIYKTPENYLREAIESILAQTFTDFELLILDDCPEDNCQAVVSSYHDKRIKYIQNDCNLGISESRNKLIKLARGEYLAVFDHDDISLPERLKKEVFYLDEHPDVGVISSNTKDIVKNKDYKYPQSDHDIKLALMSRCCIVHSASMIRKSVLIQNNIIYEEKFSPAEDYALWSRLINVTKFHNLQEVLIFYRNHEKNTSHLQAKKMQKATNALWAFLYTNYPQLYKEFLLTAVCEKQFRLCGLIPFMKKITQYNRTTIYLFGIKFLVIKKRINILTS